jgi:hypothetical protein
MWIDGAAMGPAIIARADRARHRPAAALFACAAAAPRR